MNEGDLPDEWDRAYAAGLEAARVAVAGLLTHTISVDDRTKEARQARRSSAAISQALAAIDALRGEA